VLVCGLFRLVPRDVLIPRVSRYGLIPQKINYLEINPDSEVAEVQTRFSAIHSWRSAISRLLPADGRQVSGAYNLTRRRTMYTYSFKTWAMTHEIQAYGFDFNILCLNRVSRDSSVSIVTRLRVGQPELDFRPGLRCFSLRYSVQTGSGAHPALSQLVPRVSPWVKRPGREADHSPPPSAEVKNAWRCISTPPYVFMA
jgi:hypothetical protein